MDQSLRGISPLVRRPHPVLSPVSRRYPGLGGMYPYVPIPSAALGSSEKNLAARLACLIHAANVHSEPGSNPSISLFCWNLQKKFSFDRGETHGQWVSNNESIQIGYQRFLVCASAHGCDSRSRWSLGPTRKLKLLTVSHTVWFSLYLIVKYRSDLWSEFS